MSIRDKAIEAAARAIYADMEEMDAEANKAHNDYWFCDPPENDRMIGDQYRETATAALNAILTVLADPDAGMVKAGNTAYEADYEYGIDDEDMTLAFKAMIAKVSE